MFLDHRSSSQVNHTRRNECESISYCGSGTHSMEHPLPEPPMSSRCESENPRASWLAQSACWCCLLQARSKGKKEERCGCSHVCQGQHPRNHCACIWDP